MGLNIKISYQAALKFIIKEECFVGWSYQSNILIPVASYVYAQENPEKSVI